MKYKLIPDTSIWIEYFRNNDEITEIIDHELDNGNVYITGIIIAELLYGVRSKREYDILENSFDAVPYLECGLKDWKTAGNIGNSMKKKGMTVPITDIVIASVAINNEAMVYTFDEHFKEIPGIILR